MSTELESWIERAVVDRLTTHDRRYEHDYGGVERTTDDLVATCTYVDALAAGDGTELPAVDDLLLGGDDLEPAVETALQRLDERGLVERVGERERRGPPLERGDFGTTTVWKPTVDGRAAARANREAYAAAVERLAAPHDEADLPEAVAEPLASLAREHGIRPDRLG